MRPTVLEDGPRRPKIALSQRPMSSWAFVRKPPRLQGRVRAYQQRIERAFRLTPTRYQADENEDPLRISRAGDREFSRCCTRPESNPVIAQRFCPSKRFEKSDTGRARKASCNLPDAQARVLAGFVDAEKSSRASTTKVRAPKQKSEFFVGKTKVTARQGECRLVSMTDFATLPKDRLEEAVCAFEEVLEGGPRVR